VPTASGPLYDIDTRLRPSGTQGPLSVSLEGFERYQRESAWTWEHMALARARAVFGSAVGRTAVCDIVRKTLESPRVRATVATDVLKMRADIATHKPAKGPLDVKLGEGGLVDLEFAVHFQQLVHGVGLSPDLRVAIAALAGAGLAEPELGAAHDLLTRLLVVLRLVAPDLAEPAPATCALLARACYAPDWMSFLAELTTARQCVSRHFARISISMEDQQ
jgi:glutamate-ammonia-ligase adenylyltransferase